MSPVRLATRVATHSLGHTLCSCNSISTDTLESETLAQRDELQQSGREQYEELRKQVFDSDTDHDIDKYLISETVYSPSNADTDTESSPGDAKPETDNAKNSDSAPGDEESEGIQDVWGSLDADTRSIAGEDSEADSSEE